MECDAQVSGFPGNLHSSYWTRKEGEVAYEQFLVMQSAKKQALESSNSLVPDGNDGRKVRDGFKFTNKDVIVCFLVVVVMIQSYLLYKD